MLEAAVIAARLMQYCGAVVLFGSSLFFVYTLPRAGVAPAPARWPRRLVAGAAAVLALSALAGIAAQASLFAGSFADGVTGEAMGAVVASMDLGKAAVIRAIVAAMALVAVLFLSPGRTSWLIVASLGGIAAASLAWMGHGAATEGRLAPVHLVSDILHALAAAVWLGALVSFVLSLLNHDGGAEQRRALHAALRRFAGIGSAAVAVLVLTGSVNTWILVGLDHVTDLWGSRYGRLLAIKLLLFAAMLALAALNRFKFTPALEASRPSEAIGALKRSVALETAAGLAVLALVSWLGTLAPPAG